MKKVFKWICPGCGDRREYNYNELARLNGVIEYVEKTKLCPWCGTKVKDRNK
jgi:rubrerythrin